MKLIESKAEIIPQEEGLLGVYKQIEIAGRTCYKSEDKITNNSAVEFVKKMINSGHTAMLEHGTVYLYLYETSDSLKQDFDEVYDIVDRYRMNAFSRVAETNTATLTSHKNCFYITTNLRVIVENGWISDLEYWCEPTVYHHQRATVRFTCDRGVSHELVRHRVFSFAQESTRYCNYSKDKFGNQLTFIIPSWLELNEGEYYKDGSDIVGDGFVYNMQEGDGDTDTALFIYSLLVAEKNYLALTEMGWKPQQARQILPNALKTEVVMTGFTSDWEHFFKLRLAPNAHPDMQNIAGKLYRQGFDA